MTHMFEKRDYLLLTAVVTSFIFSVGLWFAGYREEGVFVGIWVPSILGLGVYVELQSRRS